ncbi:uncharacterized protein LOC135494758 [Lineus longissimus]|uniref:uncharacterized protein LOC135494758 n=1 Tax=Lineus longissimus TaxID=88925 RepID=UPI002B4C9F84
MWEEMSAIDATLERGLLKQSDIKKKAELQRFLSTHCRIRHYMFCIKKCDDPECTFHGPPRLPKDVFDDLKFLPDPVPAGERYVPFDTLYGTETTEQHRPSLTHKEKTGHGMPFDPKKQTALNVGLLIMCEECDKWRLLHKKKDRLRQNDRIKLEQCLETISYTCGSKLTEVIRDDDDDTASPLDDIYVRENLTCNSNVELPYYSAGYDPICIYCASEDELLILSGMYPYCQNCKDNGKRGEKRRATFTAKD